MIDHDKEILPNGCSEKERLERRYGNSKGGDSYVCKFIAASTIFPLVIAGILGFTLATLTFFVGYLTDISVKYKEVGVYVGIIAYVISAILVALKAYNNEEVSCYINFRKKCWDYYSLTQMRNLALLRLIFWLIIAFVASAFATMFIATELVKMPEIKLLLFSIFMTHSTLSILYIETTTTFWMLWCKWKYGRLPPQK